MIILLIETIDMSRQLPNNKRLTPVSFDYQLYYHPIRLLILYQSENDLGIDVSFLILVSSLSICLYNLLKELVEYQFSISLSLSRFRIILETPSI